MGEHVLEHGPGLVQPSDAGQRVDMPEGAGGKRGLRLAEIIGLAIAEDVIAIAQLGIDAVHRGDKARIVRGDEADLGHQQHGSIQRLTAEGAGEGLSRLVPGFAQNGLADGVGALAPIGDAGVQAQPGGDAGQPVTGGPAHDRRGGVDMGAAAIFPDPGIRRVVDGKGALADNLEMLELQPAGAGLQPVVEKGLRRAQDDMAVDVVLDVLGGLVAEAHRPHAAIAGQVRGRSLGEVVFQRDAVDRLDMSAAGMGDRIAQEGHIGLQRADGGEAVERRDREIGIAQPAEAVIPIAFGAGMFRDRGGERGDNAAGFLVDAEFQRDGGPDHRLLPFRRRGEAA